MLRWRLLVAAIIIAPLVGLLVLDARGGVPGLWLWPLLLTLAVMAAAEVLDLLGAKNWHPVAWTTYGGTLLVVGAALMPLLERVLGMSGALGGQWGVVGWPLCALGLSVPLVFTGEMLRYRQPGNAIVHVALSLFTITYIGLSLAFLIALRSYGSNALGMAAVVSTIFVTKMADTGAYFVGRSLGRHKMTPILSPKKTVEGGIGGVVVACLSAWLFFAYVLPLFMDAPVPPTPWWGSLAYGAILAVAGTCGDLCESLLKRDMERKDSSRWMPGLGGILDVLDSLLVAAPAAYVCWATGLVRG